MGIIISALFLAILGHSDCIDREFVCRNYVHSPKSLEKQITEVQLEALNSLGYGDMADFVIAKGKLTPEDAASESIKLFTSIENLSIGAAGFNWDLLKKMENEVKAALEQAIQSQRAINQEQKDFLKEISNTVQFVSVEKYLTADKENIDRFERKCGINGLQDNATAIAIPPIVFFCPGKFLASVHRAKSFVKDYLWRTLAHEIGHHFDWFRFPFWFEDFKSCLIQNYPHEISTEPTDNRMREATADYWASEAVGVYIKNRALEGQKLPVLKEAVSASYQAFCGLFPSAFHPPAPFRIFHGLLQPDLNESIMCKESQQTYCKM